MNTGISWYIGCPASGKTTLARAHAIAAQRENGWPILVIDTEGVAQLSGFPKARSPMAAATMVWTHRKNCALIPRDENDVAAIIRCAQRPGRVNLLIDEAHVWFDATSGGALRRSILRLMRAHRHAKVRLFLTTQHLSGDIPQAALACAPTVHVFRCTAQATLERMEKTWSVDREKAKKLPQFAYLRIFDGFST